MKRKDVYEYHYNTGKYHHDIKAPMDLPNASKNAVGFRGYMDGYSGSNFNVPIPHVLIIEELHKNGMKKVIAKLSNAIRDRRDERKKTTEIEIGEIYHVKHTMRRDFYIKVQEVKGVWVEGFAMDAETMEPGEEIIVRRELCIFTQLKDKKERGRNG